LCHRFPISGMFDVLPLLDACYETTGLLWSEN
jgi:hypothetical protein